MPCDYRRYPQDWKALSRRLRFARAQGRCEQPGCGAPHGELIFRLRTDLEQWRYPTESDLYVQDPQYRGIKVVLTVAHLCACEPLCADESHLKVLCQLHHLRRDARQHAASARKTRAGKADAARALLSLMGEAQAPARSDRKGAQ